MELIFGGLFLARGYFLDVTWLMEIHDWCKPSFSGHLSQLLYKATAKYSSLRETSDRTIIS